jgi:hypothetical protein
MRNKELCNISRGDILDDICNFMGMTEKTCEKGIIYSFRLIVMMNKMRISISDIS